MVEIYTSNYLAHLTKWFGYKISPSEDFDVICQSEWDFLEILLLIEKKFSVNMLDNTKSREDFSTVKEFISWASTNPPATVYI